MSTVIRSQVDPSWAARSSYRSVGNHQNKHLVRLNSRTILSTSIISVLNLVILACAAVWFSRLGKDGPYRRIELWTNVKLSVYAFTLPIMTFFLAPLGLILSLKRRLRQNGALIWGAILLTGWIMQISLWLDCEAQSPWTENGGKSHSNYCPSLVTTTQKHRAGAIKSWTGLVVTLLIGCYMALSVLATLSPSKEDEKAENMED